MRLTELFTHVAYRPHVQQVRFHESDARFKLLIAGARFGKSLASARDVLIDALGGPSRGWLVGPTYALARPELRYIREDILARMGGGIKQSNHPPTLHTSWGAEVACMSAHMPETLLGEEIDAAEALRIGLVSRVVPSDGLDAAAQTIAATVASRGPIATRLAKEAVHRGVEMPLDQALRYELDLTVILQSTADRAEGVRAFAEKRPPRFIGR